MVPPAIAYRAGLMPLAPTAADRFRAANPTLDGRGVLIGILDSGIDPDIPGLQRTTTNEPKLLDLRDFSGEGRVALAETAPRGDSVAAGGRWLGGVAAVRRLGAAGPLFAGALRERPLGEAPACDVNGDGDCDDALPLVVARGEAGWFVLADTDGDGSLEGEQAVRDYLVARETLGWRRRGAPAPIGIAVNLAERQGRPELDLCFDTSGHGSHVAGIAAARGIGGVAGFDGVAPGAQLLGLKISDNAQGGITTTGSMMRAIAYAIGFARERDMPLVLNMSFGVGNEREGTAVIDRLVDSLLVANPDVVLAVSAGNEGPGLSTIGFPGSADRILSVGATFPGAFAVPGSAGQGVPEVVATFSSRGGELARPDLVTPGVAFSTVPRWKTGGEIEGGTSMASPHAAGLAALLVSAERAAGRPVVAERIRRALILSSRPLGSGSVLDQGAGLPDVQAAWSWLQRGHPAVPVVVRTAAGWSAARVVRMPGTPVRDSVVTFTLTRDRAEGALGLVLSRDVPWLTAPDSLPWSTSSATIPVTWSPTQLSAPGVYTGAISVREAPGGDVVARLVISVVVPEPVADTVRVPASAIARSALLRVPFRADSARGFAVVARLERGDSAVSAWLHEPGGQPLRGDHEKLLEPGVPGEFRIDGGDAVAGTYELVVGAPATGSVAVSAEIRHAPLRLGAALRGGEVVVDAVAARPGPVRAELGAMLTGAERRVRTTLSAEGPRRIPLALPSWARQVTVDVTLDRADWSRFTDLGVTLFDTAGRQLAKEPMTTAMLRLTHELAAEVRGAPAELVLFPGRADSTDRAPVAVEVRLRFHADEAVPLRTGTGAERARVAVAARPARAAFSLGTPPWTLPDGMRWLVLVVADVGEETWTREVAPMPAVAPRRGGP